MRSGGTKMKRTVARKRSLAIDVYPLKFLKTVVAVCFLVFSYFESSEGLADERTEYFDLHYFFLLKAMKYWGSHTVQVVYCILSCLVS